MGHKWISVWINGNTNSHSDGHAHTNTNSDGYFYTCTNPNAYVHANGNAHSHSFSHGYPDALSSNRSELCRRENSERADHLAERRIH